MTQPTRFALLGAAGYVAPRHMKAIKEIGGDLVAAMDPSDSVGVLDSYFPDAQFFVELERFDRHLDKLRRAGDPVRYVSICSPNHLHDAHVRFALHGGADAICEKPLVLNPWNIDALADVEASTGRAISTIMQLRLHPDVLALRDRLMADGDRVHEVDVSYVTSRGAWYQVSWKGDTAKSGGVATNIGVHFFDLLIFLFGPVVRNVIHCRQADRMAGYLELERAKVRWFLSVDRGDLPPSVVEKQSTYRSITVDGEELELSGNFADLHATSYREILDGRGFGLDDVRPSIEIVAALRDLELAPGAPGKHPFLDALGSS